MEQQAAIAENLVEELRWRGLINDASEGALDVLAEKAVTAYIGFDPTADSLHVGSLVPIMTLVHLQRHGHTPIALVGGGTGMIGDPSGKSKERSLLDEETLAHNLRSIRAQLERFLVFDGVTNPAVMLNNGDWLGELNLIAFLRDVGKHFTVNYMMAKDSVKSRLSSEEGISYTEFTYMLLQAYDFLAMYRSHGCTFQFGGSDQWGNITAGTQLIRRMDSGEAYGVTLPLVTTASGVKFGKTEAGTVWLDAERTSPFRFYQFWINTADDDVLDYLKFFTLLNSEEIDELAASLSEEPWKRDAQTRLAEEATRLVHGDDALQRAQQATEVLFGGASFADMDADELLDIFAEVPSSEVTPEQLEDGYSIVDAFVDADLETSKKRTRQLIENGGVYVNNEPVETTDAALHLADAIDGRIIVLRKGKKKYHLIRVIE
ncbi:MAG: tyrosine--tRNA ligase [Anaerolineae bacterium]